MLTPTLKKQPTRPFNYEFIKGLLFGNGEQGAFFVPAPRIGGQQVLFQDDAGTTPVESDGDPVGLMKDLSGNDNHASQGTSSGRSIYRTDGTLHWLEPDGTDDFMQTGVVPFDGSEFFTSIPMLIYDDSERFGGPFRFLRDGGDPSGTSDNYLEEYSSSDNDYTRKAVYQRYPSNASVYDNNQSLHDSGEAFVSWTLGGENAKQQVIPSQSNPTDLGDKSDLYSGDSTLRLFEGYEGDKMGGRLFGFVWSSSTPSQKTIDDTSRYMMRLAGITL